MSGAPNDRPLAAVLDDLRRALAEAGRAVLVAPPGTGKTTTVPPALLDEPWLEGRRIMMLEPRRIAARSAARFMSQLRGEPVGTTIGYRTRGDSKVGATTRVEVVTERLLTRRLQNDPELDGIGLVIFDEVHERSLDTDLGLALCLDVAASLRPDLRILAMSATADAESTAALLGDEHGPAPIIESAGVAHLVTTTYVPRDLRRRLDDDVADAVVRALSETAATGGDVLVFLPGRREIRFAADRLSARGIGTVPLTGGLDPAVLDRALAPDPSGRRKVILSTSVAQTSLTIDGVRVVVDAGLERSARFDPAKEMSALVTVGVSQAAADQRRGRAGRQAPGSCYRLWTELEHSRRRPQSEPEIEVADLSSLALDLAAWGVSDPADLAWATPPPSARWSIAVETLRQVGAIDDDGRITADGRAISRLGSNPRLGRLMLSAVTAGDADTGTVLAAVIEAGVRGDLCRAVEQPDRDAEQVARQWLRRLPTDGPKRAAMAVDVLVGALVADAFPDRVARRRDGSRTRYLLAGGAGVAVTEGSPLAGNDWLAVAEVDLVSGGDHRVISAAALTGAALDRMLADRLERRADITLTADGVLVGRSTRAVGAIVVSEDGSAPPAHAAMVAAAGRLIRDQGVGSLRWTPGARALQARAAFAATIDPSLPDVSDAAMAGCADEWLPGLLQPARKLRLDAVEAGAVLSQLLSWPQRQTIDELAPPDLTAPSGHRHAITYDPDGPHVRVKLQEMFGTPTSPTVGRGRAAVTLHLLSPAGRVLQVTQDLASFWAGSYKEVRSEMRGRYPKHTWPEDPTSATPTARTRRR